MSVHVLYDEAWAVAVGGERLGVRVHPVHNPGDIKRLRDALDLEAKEEHEQVDLGGGDDGSQSLLDARRDRRAVPDL